MKKKRKKQLCRNSELNAKNCDFVHYSHRLKIDNLNIRGNKIDQFNVFLIALIFKCRPKNNNKKNNSQF